MKRIVDIDAMLEKHQLELTLGGKAFIVKDVKLDKFLEAMGMARKEPKNTEEGFNIVHRQLAVVLECALEDVEGVGLKSAALAIDAIRDWILSSDGEVEQSSPPLT